MNQWLAYTRYFFYLLWNWNLRIAWHIIGRDIAGEKKYGIKTTGADELRHLEILDIDITHSTIYMPASYDLLETVFAKINISSFKHFVDIGCGKGRALCVAAAMGVKKVTGVELSKQFCKITEANLGSIKQQGYQFNADIKNNDAFYFEIGEDVDLIFLFNPFDEIIMSAVVENIEISLRKKGRPIAIVYLNPIQKYLFLDAGFTESYQCKRLHYLEAVVLLKSPGKRQG